MILLLFIFHYSLYLLGAVTPQKPPRGVYCEYGESHAVALRKGMEALPARAPHRPLCFYEKYAIIEASDIHYSFYEVTTYVYLSRMR